MIVYDYKSGGTSAYSKLELDPVKKGTKLQLPLYSKAIAHKYPEADISASYWFVRESGTDELKPGAEKYQGEQAESALAAAVGGGAPGLQSLRFVHAASPPAGQIQHLHDLLRSGPGLVGRMHMYLEVGDQVAHTDTSDHYKQLFSLPVQQRFVNVGGLYMIVDLLEGVQVQLGEKVVQAVAKPP